MRGRVPPNRMAPDVRASGTAGVAEGVAEGVVAEGVPVAFVLPPFTLAIGVARWRIFWTAAYFLNAVTLILVWLLNVCAPLTLEWLELSGPVIRMRLVPDEMEVYESIQCCGFPVPWCRLQLVKVCQPANIMSVQVYAETVIVSALLVGGGQCCSSPVAIQHVDETLIIDRCPEADDLPGECGRIATQPCLLRSSGVVRDEAVRVADYRRCFLACEVNMPDGSWHVFRLSRTAYRPATVALLFRAREELREQLNTMASAQEPLSA